MSVRGTEFSERTRNILIRAAIKVARYETDRKVKESISEYVEQHPEMFPEQIKYRALKSSGCFRCSDEKRYFRSNHALLKEAKKIGEIKGQIMDNCRRFCNLDDVTDYVNKFYEKDGIIFSVAQLKSTLISIYRKSKNPDHIERLHVQLSWLYKNPEDLYEELGTRMPFTLRIA